MIRLVIDPIKNPLHGQEIPTVTAQEKGESIKFTYKDGKKIPYIYHFEKPEVQRARNFYHYHIRKYMNENKIQAPKFGGPVAMTVTFFFDTKTKANIGKWKTTKPDCDNIVKLLQDQLADLDFFKVGDQQVVDLTVRKIWTDKPRIVIEIQELETRP